MSKLFLTVQSPQNTQRQWGIRMIQRRNKHRQNGIIKYETLTHENKNGIQSYKQKQDIATCGTKGDD